MAKRSRIPNKSSQRMFSRTSRTHPKNMMGSPMRGGNRL